jgi:hypothetical protein
MLDGDRLSQGYSVVIFGVETQPMKCAPIADGETF